MKGKHKRRIHPEAPEYNLEEARSLLALIDGITEAYCRAAAFPHQLLTKSHSGRENEGAPITQAEFHARAWKAAGHKARALGWIV